MLITTQPFLLGLAAGVALVLVLSVLGAYLLGRRAPATNAGPGPDYLMHSLAADASMIRQHLGDLVDLMHFSVPAPVAKVAETIARGAEAAAPFAEAADPAAAPAIAAVAEGASVVQTLMQRSEG